MFEVCGVRVTEDQMMIYSPSGEQIACHSLAEKGRKQRYIGDHKTGKNKSELSMADVVIRLESFSPDMKAYIEQIKQHNASTWRLHLRTLLALRVNYRVEDIMVAVNRARMFKIFDSGSIETFLENNSEPRYKIKLSFKPNNDE